MSSLRHRLGLSCLLATNKSRSVCDHKYPIDQFNTTGVASNGHGSSSSPDLPIRWVARAIPPPSPYGSLPRMGGLGGWGGERKSEAIDKDLPAVPAACLISSPGGFGGCALVASGFLMPKARGGWVCYLLLVSSKHNAGVPFCCTEVALIAGEGLRLAFRCRGGPSMRLAQTVPSSAIRK